MPIGCWYVAKEPVSMAISPSTGIVTIDCFVYVDLYSKDSFLVNCRSAYVHIQSNVSIATIQGTK